MSDAGRKPRPEALSRANLETLNTPERSALLTVKNLTVRYRGRDDTTEAVKRVNVDIAPGEIVAIVGGSGSGKSTLVNAILHLLPGNAMYDAETLMLDGRALRSLSAREWQAIRGKVMRYVPQDPTVSLDPVKTIGAQLMETMQAHGTLRRNEMRERAVALLHEVGIRMPERRFSQYPHELSGGMQQRVLIAIALSCDPQLIIADEPTSGLDVTVQKQVLDRLATLVRERNTAVLLITHDLGLAAERADRILVMQEGCVVEQGNARAVLNTPTSAYTRALVDAIPGPRGNNRDDESSIAAPLLVVDNLSKTFHAGWLRSDKRAVTAVHPVSLALTEGRTLGIVGESGSGKTTLARMIAGLEQATSGTVLYRDRALHDERGRVRSSARRAIQYVYQNPYRSLNPLWTIEELVGDPLRVNGIGDPTSRKAQVRELIDAVALPRSVLTRRADGLSGGQLQRVAIARALSLSPEILILDEPVSALDVIVQAHIVALLIRLQQERCLSYLFISHDLAVVREIAHDTLVMRAGQVIERGPARQVFTAPASDYARALIDAIPGCHLGMKDVASHTDDHARSALLTHPTPISSA